MIKFSQMPYERPDLESVKAEMTKLTDEFASAATYEQARDCFVRKDALATGLHVYYIQRKYPHAEMSLSCPRLRPIINNDKINNDVIR